MECLVCNVRSSSGYCAECRTLLCDECRTLCEECAKALCPEHVHRSRSGRALCVACFGTSTRRHEAHGLFDDGPGVPRGIISAEYERREREREERARSTTRPWKLSLYVGAGTCLLGVALLAVPLLRTIPTSDRQDLPSGYLLLLPALLAVGIAAAGFAERLPQEHRAWNLLGLFAGLVALALAVTAVRLTVSDFEAAEQALIEGKTEKERHDMTPRELQEWRHSILDRYKKQ